MIYHNLNQYKSVYSPTLAGWKSRGAHHEINGLSVFTIDEGEGSLPVLLFLHGYPSCSFDFHRVLPVLTPHFRVIVHDHPGFGLSDKPEKYSYSLIDQADIALLLWRKLGIREGHLVAHDYGTSVATELIARRNMGYQPVKLLSATLGNGSMLIEMSNLRVIQVLLRSRTVGPLVARLTSKYLFDINMKRLWGDRRKVDQEELDLLWEMINYKDGRRVLPHVTQYLRERRKFWHRWVGNLYRTDLPVHILWGEEDPVAVVEMAHELHRRIPNNQMKLLPGLGHYPMLEAPEVWAAALLEMVG